MARRTEAAKRSARGQAGSPASDSGEASAAEPDKELSALSFEQLLERLEGVVESLEEGDAPLEEALSTFERGVMLSRLGAQRLDEAERRIEVLLRNGRTRPLQHKGEQADDEEPDDDD